VTQTTRSRSFLPHLARRIPAFVLFVIFSISARAQFTPAETAVLNYRIIGFSFPAKKATSGYVVEIAAGSFSREAEFASHISQEVSSQTNKVIIEVPSFGAEYTWRVVYKHLGAVTATSSLHHFSTGALPENGVSAKRLRVDTKAQGIGDSYILVDGVNKIFDMEGNPVWYLPGVDSTASLTDMKISPSGTITFLDRGDAYEVSYDGRTLWKYNNERGRGGAYTAAFHHEYSKLTSGHYMSLLSDMPSTDVKQQPLGGRKRFFPRFFTSTIQEFDEKGKLVWSWNSQDYIQRSDLQALHKQYSAAHLDLHENAFCFDEKNNVIYLCMAGISRIVKIQYPSGKVLATYGTVYRSSAPGIDTTTQTGGVELGQMLANGMFGNPHALKLSGDGCIYVYSSKKDSGKYADGRSHCYPKILKMKQAGHALEKVWELNCEALAKEPKEANGGGGNVMELPGNRLFVSLGIPYSDMYIVDADKSILWSAMVDVYIPNNNSWMPYLKYRASIITRQQLEQLIQSGKEFGSALSIRHP
jgi:hypothetical protein